MIENKVEIIETTTKNIKCDGGAIKHPRIYLNMGKNATIHCTYCGRKFIYIGGDKKNPTHDK